MPCNWRPQCRLHTRANSIALANKDDAAALSAAQDYAKRQPGPASADTLARTYATLNRIGDAVNVLAESQAKYPNSCTLIFLTALLRKKGDVQKADAMLTDWIAQHPEDMTMRMAYRASIDHQPCSSRNAISCGAEIAALQCVRP